METPASVSPLLIIGRTGTLGQGFARICDSRGLRYVLLSRQEIDIASSASIQAALDTYRPWAVVNTAGYVRVDEAEKDFRACFRENTIGPLLLAYACNQQGVPLLSFSSDLVFDGEKGSAYLESDPVGPLNIYGKSKADAERQVLQQYPDALMVRTSAFFGPWDRHNFVTTTLQALAAGRPVQAATDLVVSPTYIPDLINSSLDLLIDGESGIWHVSNDGAVSWAELAVACARMGKVDHKKVVPCSGTELGLQARRPALSALGSERGAILPSLDDALQRYFCDCQIPLKL